MIKKTVDVMNSVDNLSMILMELKICYVVLILHSDNDNGENVNHLWKAHLS